MTFSCSKCEPPIVGLTNKELYQHNWSRHTTSSCAHCGLTGPSGMISNHKSHCAAQPPITCAVCSLTLKNLRSLREHNKTSKHERNAALAAQTVVHLPPALNELLTTVAKASTTSLHAGAAQPHPQLDDTLPLHDADNFGDFGGFDFVEGNHAHAQGNVHDEGAWRRELEFEFEPDTLAAGASAPAVASAAHWGGGGDDDRDDDRDDKLDRHHAIGYGVHERALERESARFGLGAGAGVGVAYEDAEVDLDVDQQSRNQSERSKRLLPEPSVAGVHASSGDGRSDKRHRPAVDGASAAQWPLVSAVFQSDAVRELLRQQAFQQTFWENLGTNSSSKATTRNTRAAAGLKLVNRYLDAIAAGGGNMAPVATDALLVDYTSYAYGVALASALLASARSSARVGSPIAFLELTSDKDSDIAAYLEKLGLSKTTALTALAMVLPRSALKV